MARKAKDPSMTEAEKKARNQWLAIVLGGVFLVAVLGTAGIAMPPSSPDAAGLGFLGRVASEVKDPVSMAIIVPGVAAYFISAILIKDRRTRSERERLLSGFPDEDKVEGLKTLNTESVLWVAILASAMCVLDGMFLYTAREISAHQRAVVSVAFDRRLKDAADAMQRSDGSPKMVIPRVHQASCADAALHLEEYVESHDADLSSEDHARGWVDTPSIAHEYPPW